MLASTTISAVVALGFLFVPPTTLSRQKQDASADRQKPGAAAGEMTPEMKAAMAAMMPGPAHQKLAELAGQWTTHSKFTLAGAPSEETDGTARISVVMGGRFLHEEAQGTMMGMPVQSAKLIGYNNGSKKYESVWTYTLGTNMMTMTGASKDAGKTIRFDAAWDNESGVREKIKITYAFADANHFTVTMGGGEMPDGSEGPEMVTTYTRKK